MNISEIKKCDLDKYDGDVTDARAMAAMFATPGWKVFVEKFIGLHETQSIQDLAATDDGADRCRGKLDLIADIEELQDITTTTIAESEPEK